MQRASCAQASQDHGPAGTHACRREIRLVLHTVLNKVIAKNTTLDWWRGQGGESVEEKGKGRVREALQKKRGREVEFSRWQEAGKIGTITQHSTIFCY